jgi:RNA polymerase sigma-70 factor (ECF subfamily)
MTTAEKPPDLPASPAASVAAPAPSAVDGQAVAPEASVSDTALVERARNKDYSAFEELLARYEDKIYRLAYRFVRNESEAKEILQDTFLAVWRKLDTFKGDAQFSSWVYRVAANAALMRLRSHRRHPEVSTEDLPAGFLDQNQSGQVLSAGDNWARRPDDELQSSEVRQHIQAAVDALPEIYRTVFLVRDVEGMSTEETAELLGISVPTVKTRLHRARIALRHAITEYFGKK